MSNEDKERIGYVDCDAQDNIAGKENFAKKQVPPEEDAEKVKNNKNLGADSSSEVASIRRLIFALCYFCEILFFIPLIMYKDSKATRHANEGLVILLFSFVGSIIYGVLISIFVFINLSPDYLFNWIGILVVSIIFIIYSIGLLALKIIGIIYALTDKDKELPILGKIKLIK